MTSDWWGMMGMSEVPKTIFEGEVETSDGIVALQPSESGLTAAKDAATAPVFEVFSGSKRVARIAIGQTEDGNSYVAAVAYCALASTPAEGGPDVG